MAKDIYVEANALSASMLNKVQGYIDTAQAKINQFGSSPSYRGPDGYTALYTSDMITELNSIRRKLASLETQLQHYATILNSGPDALVRIDREQKNVMTTWWERTKYTVGGGNCTLDWRSLGSLGMFGSLFTQNSFISGGETLVHGYTAGGGGYASSGGGGGAFGGSSGGRFRDEAQKYPTHGYTAGGGGYASGGGGKGAFGSGGGGMRGVEKPDKTGNILVDSWNDYKYSAKWFADKYDQLDEVEKDALEELGEEILGSELYYALEITKDISTDDVSWSTLKSGLKAIKANSMTVNVIVETCETVTNPAGTMKTLIDGHDMFMDSATKKFVNGDIGGGFSDLGMSVACGLCGIVYGVGEVSTEVLATTISSFTDKVTLPLKVIDIISPEITSEVIGDIGQQIGSVSDVVTDWISNLLK